MTETFVPPPTMTEPPEDIHPPEAKIWTGIGPWVNINDLAIDPLTPSILFAATGGGMFKSTNSGESWSAVNSGLTELYIEDVVIDPVTPTTIYAALGYFTTGGGGVFKSVDGGNNWLPAKAGLPNNVSNLVIDPLTPTTLYVITDFHGVFKSTNGGENWRAVNTGLADDNPVLALIIDPVTPSTLYLGTYRDGVFKSTDNGEHWSAINTGIDLKTTDENSVDHLVIDPVMPTTVYAVTRYGGIYKSTNGGQDWKAFNIGLEATWTGYNHLTLDPTTPGTLYVVTDQLYKSTDGGKNWQVQLYNPNASSNTFVSVITMDPVDTNVLYIGTQDDGIHTNRTYEAFISVQMPSLTPPPTAATEAPALAVPAPTQTITSSVRPTLAPLKFPFIASGQLNNRKEIQLSENSRLLVLWYVIAEDPQYMYVFGEGTINFAANSFEIVLYEPPPSEALNWMGSSAMGVGLLIITTDQALQTGKMQPEAISDTDLLGASGQYSIIYVNDGFEIGEYIPWYNEFMPGYSAGKGVYIPGDFDAFEPTDPGTIEIIIDDMQNIEFVNWT